MDIDLIKKYSVKIMGTKEGSGVIVKPIEESDYFYILTVKHVLDESLDSQNIEIIHKDNTYNPRFKWFDFITIDLSTYNSKDASIYGETDGIIIFILSKKKQNEQSREHLNSLDSIDILNSSFEKCIIIGYPEINNEQKRDIASYECFYETDILNENSTSISYQVKSNSLLNRFARSEDECIKGLSGSGVFTQDRSGRICLVGLQIQITMPIHLVCLDLSKLSEEINKEITNYKEYSLSKIAINRCSHFDTLDINPDDLNLKELKDKLNYKKTIGYLDDDKKIKKFGNEIAEQLKIIGDAYLYRGIDFHEKGDHRRANYNFKNAEKYYPQHRTYFLEAKEQQKQKQKQSNKKLLHAKRKQIEIEDILSNKNFIIDKEQKTELLKQLTYIDGIVKVPEQEKNYLNLLDMYYQQDREGENPEINDKKAKIFFTLGALYYKHKKYNDSKNALLGSINLLEKDTTRTKSLIRCYGKLVNAFCKQEKYEEAKKYCLKIVENPESTEQNKFEIYTGLLSISYFLKEDEEQTNKYYQKANKCLDVIKQDKHINHEKLTNDLKKIWLATQKNIVNKDLKVQNSMQQGISSLEKSNNDLKIQLKDFEDRMGIVTDSIKDNKVEIENYVEYKTQEITQKLNDIKNILDKFSPSPFDLLRKFFKWIKEKIFKVHS